MPDTSQPSGSTGGGLGGTLKAKFGPLPVWIWLALITAVLLGYWLLTKNKAGASSTPQPGTPADVGQPGVVVINQDQPGGTGPPGPPGPPGPTSPPNEPSSRQITLDKNETLAQLAQQRHWSSATLAKVEQMNVQAGQGQWTPQTQLKKGQTVIRPLNG